MKSGLFAKLVLDDTNIESIEEVDKAYLEKFESLAHLSMNKTRLTSLNNLPAGLNMKRLDLGDNFLKGEDLKKLALYKDHLRVLKVGNNKIASYDDLDVLKEFEHLTEVDFESNPFAGGDAKEYREKIFEKLP